MRTYETVMCEHAGMMQHTHEREPNSTSGSGAHLGRDGRLAGEPLVQVGILHVDDRLELLQLLLAERAEVVARLCRALKRARAHAPKPLSVLQSNAAVRRAK